MPSAVPQKIRDLLRRCLQKDKAQRFRDAGDARIEIEDAIAAPKDSGATQTAPVSTSKPLLAVGAVAAVLVAFLGVTSWGWWRSTRPVERPLVRLDVDLGPDVSLGSPFGADAILSPDGTRLVYVSQGRLFTRRLDQPNATELPGTQGAYAPFFSPDGHWVAFFATGKLKKISVDGGSAITLCDAPAMERAAVGTRMATSSPDSSDNDGLARIPSAGGPPTPVTDLQSGETIHRWPQILPGGKAVLFTASTTRGWVRRSQHRSDVSDRPSQENARARRHVWSLFAKRPSDFRKPRHAVCCTFRPKSAGGARDPFASAGPSRLQR